MANSIRRPARLYQFAMWCLSLVFAGFLIGLGSLIIADLPRVDRSITVTDYIATDAVELLDKQRSDLLVQQSGLRRTQEDASADLGDARNDLAAARSALTAWLATRDVTRDAAQDPEVLARTRAVEALENDVLSRQNAVSAIDRRLTEVDRQLTDLGIARNAVFDEARPEFNAAMQAQRLKVFAMRLALTLPLLVIAGFLVARTRSSQYWPLHRGFVLFALFAFFVELVPYLPSYGGYVRYGVGIIATLIAGHFIIRAMRRYLARQQSAEARSEQDRRQSITYETALKKLAAKTCPGCDRSIYTRDGDETDFCVHCGIRLQSDCGACGTRNLSFHRFCISCGEPNPEMPAGPGSIEQSVPT